MDRTLLLLGEECSTHLVGAPPSQCSHVMGSRWERREGDKRCGVDDEKKTLEAGEMDQFSAKGANCKNRGVFIRQHKMGLRKP